MNMSKEANVYVVWHCESSEYSYVCFAKLISDTNHGKDLLCDPFNPQSLHSLENISIAVHTHLCEVALWVKATCPSIREGIAHTLPAGGETNRIARSACTLTSAGVTKKMIFLHWDPWNSRFLSLGQMIMV